MSSEALAGGQRTPRSGMMRASPGQATRPWERTRAERSARSWETPPPRRWRRSATPRPSAFANADRRGARPRGRGPAGGGRVLAQLRPPLRPRHDQEAGVRVSAALEAKAEIAKLARLLGTEPEELDYLKAIGPEELREVRTAATDRLFDDDGGDAQAARRRRQAAAGRRPGHDRRARLRAAALRSGRGLRRPRQGGRGGRQAASRASSPTSRSRSTRARRRRRSARSRRPRGPRSRSSSPARTSS